MMQAVLVVFAVVAGLWVVIGLGSARSIVWPGRARVWSNPRKETGLDYEDVAFAARDGVRLKGWMIPAADARGDPRASIILVHGWLWNRLGNQQSNPINDFPGGKRVMLMPLAAELARAGYNVLMFDLRNFGESERRGVYTGGWLESRDLLGALDYLV